MSKGVELRLFLGLALLAATPSGASAQCLLCGASESAKTTAGRGGQTPLHVEVETQLDMGRVAAGSGGGEVAIDPVTGVRRVSGDVRDLGGFALTGVVTVRGEPGAEVRVFLPARRRTIVVMSGSSIVPSISGWLERICSTSVDPERGMPTTKIGSGAGQPASARAAKKAGG